MPGIDCFPLLGLDKDELDKLTGSFRDLVAKGMSERDAGVKIANDLHEKLHNDLEDFKKSISLIPARYKVEPFKPFDNSEKVKAVNDKYDKLIEDKKNELASKKEGAPVVEPVIREKAEKKEAPKSTDVRTNLKNLAVALDDAGIDKVMEIPIENIIKEVNNRVENNPNVRIGSLNSSYAVRLRAELESKGIDTNEQTHLTDIQKEVNKLYRPKQKETKPNPEGEIPKISSKVKNKFANFKKQIENEQDTSTKEQVTEGGTGQGGDKVGEGDNGEPKKPEPKVKVLKKRAKPTIKSPLFKKALANEAQDPLSQVLKYFIGGGRINREALKEFHGDKTAELNSKISLQGTGPDAPKTIDEFAHKLWDNSPDNIKDKYDTEDFRGAIETVLQEHNSRTSMAEQLANALPPEEQEMADWYNKFYGGIENEIPEENFNQAIDILEGLSDEEIQKLADAEDEGLSKLAEQYAPEQPEEPVGEFIQTEQPNGGLNEGKITEDNALNPSGKTVKVDKLVGDKLIPQEEAETRKNSWKDFAKNLGKDKEKNKHKVIISLFDFTGTWSRPFAEAGYTVISVDIQHEEREPVNEEEAIRDYVAKKEDDYTDYKWDGKNLFIWKNNEEGEMQWETKETKKQLEKQGIFKGNAMDSPDYDAILEALNGENNHLSAGVDLMKDHPYFMVDLEEAIKASGKEVVGMMSATPCTTFAGSGARWWPEHDGINYDEVEKRYGTWAAKHFESPNEYNKFLVGLTEEYFANFNPKFSAMENPVGRIKTEMDLPDETMSFHPNNFGDPYTKKTNLWGKFNTDLPVAPVEATEGSKIQSKLSSKQKIERSTTPEGFSYAFFVAQHKALEAEAQGEAPKVSQADVDKAQSQFDKAERDLKKAQDKLAGKQSKQGDLLSVEKNVDQGDMFANVPKEAFNTLEPYKQKVREAKANLAKVTEDFNKQNEPQAPSNTLFQQREPTSKEVEQMKDIVKDLQDEGVTDLKKIQAIAAKELGDNSQQLKDLVEDAFHEAGKELKLADTNAKGETKSNELTTSFAKRINNFVDKIFGKSKEGERTVVLKNSDALMSAAKELQKKGKVQFQNINDNTQSFYSPLEKFIENNKQGAFTVDQVLGQIKSLPQAEIEAVGLRDFLKDKTKVTKQELLDYIKENKVNVETVVKGRTAEHKGQLEALQSRLNSLNQEKEDLLKKHLGSDTDAPQKDIDRLTELGDNISRFEDKIAELKSQNNTKYGDYTLPGEKSNYREVLLTMPKGDTEESIKKQWIDANQKAGISVERMSKINADIRKSLTNNDRAAFDRLTNEKEALEKADKEITAKFKPLMDAALKRGREGFNSSHFDEPNILAHIRLTDRTTPEGKRILFVEEAQSDWAREGRSKGFAKQQEEIKWKNPRKVDGNKIYDSEDYNFIIIDRGEGGVDLMNALGEVVNDGKYKTVKEAMEAANGESRGFAKGGTVPDMPFKGDKWQELATKKAIQIASQEGYDGVAWINGEQTADRYDLSKQVDHISYWKSGSSNSEYQLKVIDNQGNEHAMLVPENKLADHVGKDVAEKIINGEGQHAGTTVSYGKKIETKKLSGLDLKVGGAWAKNLYDKQIPKLVEKYAKQFGGKVGYFQIDTQNRGKQEERDGQEGRHSLEELKQFRKKAEEEIARGEMVDWNKSLIKELDKSIAEISKQKLSNQFGLEITPDMKDNTSSVPMFMKDDKGEVLGFTHNGKIYLNGEKLNPNTPVHEAGHIWTNWAKENSPQLHARGLELTENSRYLRKVKDNKFYQDEAAKLPKAEQENYFKEEALAAAIGDKGAQFISEAKKKSFADWAKQLWHNIGQALGFKNVTAKDIQNMTLNEFSKRAAADILKGEPQKLSDEKTTEKDSGIPKADEGPDNTSQQGVEDESVTAIRKAKQLEIKAVEKAYKEQKRKGWSETMRTGLEKIAKANPAKHLYDAAVHTLNQIRSGNYGDLSRDEAAGVMHYLKHEVGGRRADLEKDTKSDDPNVRMAALLHDEPLKDIYENAALAIKDIGTEAGRTLSYMQSELFDDEHGLQIRRMDLMRAGGAQKLSPEDEKWTAEQWEHEKEVAQKIQEAKEASMQENFNKELEKIKKDYEDKLKAKAKEATVTDKNIREKTLAQSGKALADKIRRFKSPKGALQTDITFGLRNAAVELVAQIVEQGTKLADAIKQVLQDEKFKGLNEEDLTNHLIEIANKKTPEETLEKIKEFAKENELTDVSKEMVGKNLIKEYIDSHIGEVDQKDILDKAVNDLKEVLPDIDKKKLIEAYLKEGDYKQETKKDLEGGIKEQKKQLESIAKLEEDISDLKGFSDTRRRSSPDARNKSEYEQQLLDKKQAIIKENRDLRNQILADNRRIETERNRQMSKIQELRDKKAKLEAGIRERQKRSPSKDTPEIEDLKRQVADADSKLRQEEVAQRKAQREARQRQDRLDELNANIKRAEAGQDIIKTYRNKSDKEIDEEIASKKKQLKKVINDNTTEEKVQEKLLKQAKENAIRRKNEFQRRYDEGEFEEPIPKTLNKHDAELIRLHKEQSEIEEKFRKKQREIREANKSTWERLADFGRSMYVAFLIGSFKTLSKVGTLALLRPASEIATKTTLLKVFDKFFPGISKAALGGGESSSWRSTKLGMDAYFRQMGNKAIEAKAAKSEAAYQKADKAYTDFKTSLENQKKDTEEFQLSKWRLEKLKKERDNALFATMGNLVYQFIGGSSLKDSLKSFINRSNEIEKQFGKVEGESYKEGNWLDKINYVMGFVGRSHSALKTFSGRYSFASGFMARMESAVNNGVELSADRVLEIAHESYLDWERGKYQQSNYITELWNKVVNSVDKGTKGTEMETAATLGKAFLKTEVAITRVPVNIIHEAVMEYTLGAFRVAGLLHDQASIPKLYSKFKGELKDQGLLKGSPEFKAALKEKISQMDEKQAALIARNFRKGGLGIGLYALSLILGGIHFGIFPHMGQKKKKDEAELGKDELNPGQVMVGDTKLGEVASSVIEHIPALWPTFMGLGMAQEYHDQIKKGKMPAAAAGNAIYTHLQVVEGNIPQTKLADPLKLGGDVVRTIKKRLQEMGVVDKDLPQGWDKKDTQDPAFKFYFDKGVKFSPFDPEKVELPSTDAAGVPSKTKLTDLPPEKWEEFNDARKQALKENLEDLKDKDFYVDANGKVYTQEPEDFDTDIKTLDQLTPAQLKKVIEPAEAKATSTAKEQLGDGRFSILNQ